MSLLFYWQSAGPTIVEADAASAGIATPLGAAAAVSNAGGASAGAGATAGAAAAVWITTSETSGIAVVSGEASAVWVAQGSADGSAAALADSADISSPDIPVQVDSAGAGGRGGRSQLRRRRRYFSEVAAFNPKVADAVEAAATVAVEQLITEPQRISYLAEELRQQDVQLASEHIAAMEAIREKMAALETAALIRRLQDQEDETFLLILAEAL